MKIGDILSEAAGRTIVIGENHRDRTALMKIRRLIQAAHNLGYRKLGIEFEHERAPEVPFDDILDATSLVALLRSRGRLEISEFDSSGLLSPNMFFFTDVAVGLGWEILGVDPLHRERFAEIIPSEKTDLAIAAAIRAGGTMIAVLGMAHAPNVLKFMGDSIMFVSSMVIPKDGPIRSIYRRQLGNELFDFVDSLPSIA